MHIVNELVTDVVQVFMVRSKLHYHIGRSSIGMHGSSLFRLRFIHAFLEERLLMQWV